MDEDCKSSFDFEQRSDQAFRLIISTPSIKWTFTKFWISTRLGKRHDGIMVILTCSAPQRRGLQLAQQVDIGAAVDQRLDIGWLVHCCPVQRGVLFIFTSINSSACIYKCLDNILLSLLKICRNMTLLEEWAHFHLHLRPLYYLLVWSFRPRTFLSKTSTSTGKPHDLCIMIPVSNVFVLQ